MSRKIVFIGGGSAKFVREVVIDIFSYEELRDMTITLMDIDQKRVKLSEQLVKKIIRDRKLSARVESTLNQKKALEAADYVIITIMVGGYDFYKMDVAIPAQYGVFQSISDTTGPGGIMRIIRTSPVLQQIVKDLKEVAPDAWILNHANPMSMNTWTLLQSGHKRTIGLCHSIQGSYRGIAGWLNLPPEEIQYSAGGINHINFYLTLEHNGRNIYPELLANAPRIIKKHPAERVRFELLEYLGYFPAEGPCHQAEYYPWFIKNKKMVNYYGAETFHGYHNDLKNFNNKFTEIKEQLAGRTPISYERSQEFTARIIHSLKTGQTRRFYGNVINERLIENLPPQAIVEVPCFAGKNGIAPHRVGTIPQQLAAVMTPHIHLHEMAVKGVLQKERALIRQAIQSDPLTGAILTLPKIKEMTDELLEANKDYIKDWN